MRKKLLLVGVFAVAASLAGCSEPNTTATGGSTTPTATQSGQSNACVYAPDSAASKPVDPPAITNPETTGILTVTMHMGAGVVTMNLDRAGAPCAVNSFESLASQGYFDGTSCHRLVPGFVLQCGDPLGTGYGGPGYRFADELSGKETYVYGTVAMANGGPNTNGSQFFIVIADVAQLPPEYVVLGSVEPESMSVIMDGIVAFGVDLTDPKGERPLADASINSVTLG